jgi:hypothetical protein
MNSGERLWWGASVAAALLVGLLIGIFIGGEIEQDALVEIIAKVDLTQECREQLQSAASAIVEAWESSAPSAD